MNTKTWLILGALIAGGVMLAVLIPALSSGEPVEAAAATRGRIREYVDERAKTRLPETHTITMPYPGRILPITLTENTPVREGQVVAHVVPEDLDLAVAEVQTKLREVDAAIAQNADTSVEQTAMDQTDKFVSAMKATTLAAGWQTVASKLAKEYAIQDYGRVKQLHSTGTETDEELDQAFLRKGQSEASYWQAMKSHESMKWMDVATELMPKLLGEYIARKKFQEAILLQQKAQVTVRLQQAELNRRRGTMTSPIDGVILRRYVTGKRQLAPGTPLLEIGRLERLEIEADVLSVDVVGAKEDAKVEIYGPAIGEPKARGTVEKIYPGGFTKISSLGVEQQRVKVIVHFDSGELERLVKERRLGVGYDVRVRIFTDEKSDALIVPRAALFRGTDGNWQVYAINNGRAKLEKVQVGLMNDEQVQITKGLSEGEQVILAPESNLIEGTKVKAVEK